MKPVCLCLSFSLAAGALAQPAMPNGPADHQVQSASSKDGLTWTRDEGIRISRASVPCAINDDDKRVLIYFVQPPDQPGKPETVACAVSTDGMKFEQAHEFQIEGLSTLKAVDPSIMKDSAGKFRLYYLASNHRGDPASGANPHKINVAMSDDGIRFREAGTVFEYNDLVDPDVFRFKNQWFMYVFARGGTVIATSPDGARFTYARAMSPPGWGTVAPLVLADGRLRLYAFDQRTPIGNSVRSFLSTDGLTWTMDAGERLKANENEQITDPFVIPWRGGYKMYFKTSPARTRSLSGNRPPQGASTGGLGDSKRAGSGPARGAFPPLPAGEGRGEGERVAQGPNNFNPPPPQNLNADGPWNRDVIAYRVSADGSVEKVATFERAGVPTVARMKDGRLISAFQNFPADDNRNFDRVAVRFSSDEGCTWTAVEPIAVDGMEAGLARPFDPTLVPLPDGRVRLYFTSNRSPDFRRSTSAIYSAVSTDGVNYTFEPGVRFGLEGRVVIDCAAVLHQGVFHLYVPDNGTAEEMRGQQQRREPPGAGVAYHATSQDGLNFTRAADVRIEGRRRWLGNAQSDGKTITFFGTGDGTSAGGPGGQPRGGLWMATSSEGQTWKLTQNPPITGGDPGAVRTKDGGWVVVITGEAVRRVSPKRAGVGNALNEMWSRGQATGRGTVQLKFLPLRVEDIQTVIPMGMMVHGHVIPSDHLSLQPKDRNAPSDRYEVIALADGFIVDIHRPPSGNPDPGVRSYAGDCRIVIEHSATFYTWFGLVDRLEESVVKAAGGLPPAGPPAGLRIPVKAGQVIGRIGGAHGLDFTLINTESTLKGFVKPAQFLNRDQWKPHVTDPFPFLEEPLRSKLLALNPRKAEPRGGRIDYDVDGTLAGNWYREGTGGYAGLKRRMDYWTGHLAFAYHHIDPAQIVISVGDFDGRPRQFWSKGNAPDPTNVTERDGIVKYELIWGRINNSGQPFDGIPTTVQGVVLAQVLPGRRLKFEAFPGGTAAQIQGFTDAAGIYER